VAGGEGNQAVAPETGRGRAPPTATFTEVGDPVQWPPPATECIANGGKRGVRVDKEEGVGRSHGEMVLRWAADGE
jgi:hypothetical protein